MCLCTLLNWPGVHLRKCYGIHLLQRLCDLRNMGFRKDFHMISQNEAQLSFWGVAAFVALVGIFSYGLGCKVEQDKWLHKQEVANDRLQICNKVLTAGNR